MNYVISFFFLFFSCYLQAQEISESKLRFENLTDVQWSVEVTRKGVPIKTYIKPGEAFTFKVVPTKEYRVVLEADDRPSYWVDYQEVGQVGIDYQTTRRIRGDIGHMRQVLLLEGGHIFAIVGPLLEQT